MSRAAPLACALAVVAASAGCIVIPRGHAPGPGAVAPPAVETLREGSWSRADVLMRLGDPDERYLDDRAFGYRWKESLATVIFAAGYQAGGFDVDETRQLMLAFSPAGQLVRVDVLHAIGRRALDEQVRGWLSRVEDERP